MIYNSYLFIVCLYKSIYLKVIRYLNVSSMARCLFDKRNLVKIRWKCVYSIKKVTVVALTLDKTKKIHNITTKTDIILVAWNEFSLILWSRRRKSFFFENGGDAKRMTFYCSCITVHLCTYIATSVLNHTPIFLIRTQ